MGIHVPHEEIKNSHHKCGRPQESKMMFTFFTCKTKHVKRVSQMDLNQLFLM